MSRRSLGLPYYMWISDNEYLPCFLIVSDDVYDIYLLLESLHYTFNVELIPPNDGVLVYVSNNNEPTFDKLNYTKIVPAANIEETIINLCLNLYKTL